MSVTDLQHPNPDLQSSRVAQMSKLEDLHQEDHPEQLSREYLRYLDLSCFSTLIEPSNVRNITRSKFESQQ